MVSYKKVNELNKEKAAYLAGIIDGEGTITLSKKQKGAQRHLAVTISSTELDILEFIKKTIGAGKITKKVTYKAHHSTAYTYALYSRQALKLLDHIYPYMQGYKKKRAKLVMDKYLVLTPRNGKYSDELLENRKKFVKQFFGVVAK